MELIAPLPNSFSPKTLISGGINKNVSPLIQAKGLNKNYSSPTGTIKALKNINLEISQGEFLVISGRSGSGKTTLVNMLTGLDRLSTGEIWVDEKPVYRLNQEQLSKWRLRNVGIVFQSFSLIPTLTALQNVTLPMDFLGWGTKRQREERGLDLLKQLGMENQASKLPSQVSGGQQQRIAIARSLANDPRMLVADEPTGSLDSKTAVSVFEIFESLAEKGKTIVMVTHDRDLAKKAKHSIILVDGEIQ